MNQSKLIIGVLNVGFEHEYITQLSLGLGLDIYS